MNRNRTGRHLLHVVAIALSAVVLGVFPGGMLRSTVAHASYARGALGSAVGTRGSGLPLVQSVELGAKLGTGVPGGIPPGIIPISGVGDTPYQWMRWVTTNGPGFYNNFGVFAEPVTPVFSGDEYMGSYFFLNGQDPFGNPIFRIQVMGDVNANGEWELDLWDHLDQSYPNAVYTESSTSYPTAAQAAQPFRQCIASWVTQFGQTFSNLIGDADGTAGEVGDDVEQLEEMIAQVI